MGVTPFYKNKNWEEQYRKRINFYREGLVKHYPELFDWEFHSRMVIEMVRCELELDYLDNQIGNDINKSEWLGRPRHQIRDALFRYRRELGVTPNMMKKLKEVVEKEVDFEDLFDQEVASVKQANTT